MFLTQRNDKCNVFQYTIYQALLLINVYNYYVSIRNILSWKSKEVRTSRADHLGDSSAKWQEFYKEQGRRKLPKKNQ